MANARTAAKDQSLYISRELESNLQDRLSRIEGHVRGIKKMLAGHRDCDDILTQVSAMTKALQAVSLGLLDEHMHHCVADAARAGEAEGRAKIDEAVAAITRLVKS